MFLLLVLAAGLCLYGISFHNSLNIQYLGKEETNAVKGLFVLLVFFAHVVQYIHFNDTMADKLFDFIMGLLGQNIVIAFLLYSGYGIGRAYMARGGDYLKQLPKNRILNIWLHFALGVLLFWAVDLFLVPGGYSPLEYILSLFAWRSVGNSTWFVFVILLCWIFTYFSFLLLKNRYQALAVLTVMLCIYIVVIAGVKEGHLWYDTVLCYPLGLLFAFQKDKLDNFFGSGVRTLLAIVLLGILWIVLRLFIEKNVVLYEVQSIAFALFLLAVTSRVTIGNRVLAWLGKHSFSVYLLQRIPMIILNHFGISVWNRWLFIAASAAATCLLSWGFDRMMAIITGKIQRKTARA